MISILGRESILAAKASAFLTHEYMTKPYVLHESELVPKYLLSNLPKGFVQNP